VRKLLRCARRPPVSRFDFCLPHHTDCHSERLARGVKPRARGEETAPLPMKDYESVGTLPAGPKKMPHNLYERSFFKRMTTYYVYIISNKSRRLYVGFTSDLPGRAYQHKTKTFKSSFTARYVFDMLVYYECFASPTAAIRRETEIKAWRREKKLRLILAVNPDWADLSKEWGQDESWQRMDGMLPSQVYTHSLAAHEPGGAVSSPLARGLTPRARRSE